MLHLCWGHVSGTALSDANSAISHQFGLWGVFFRPGAGSCGGTCGLLPPTGLVLHLCCVWADAQGGLKQTVFELMCRVLALLGGIAPRNVPRAYPTGVTSELEWRGSGSSPG